MKKTIFTFFMAITLIFATNTEIKSQTTLGLNAGYSWLQGVVGGEINSGHFGLGLGYMPTTMPGSGTPVTSVSWFITYSDAIYQKSSGYYLSFGSASNGYRSEVSYNGGAYTDGFTSPMWIAMLGYKYNWYSGLNAKLGFGYGWCEYAGVFTWELTIGYSFELGD